MFFWGHCISEKNLQCGEGCTRAKHPLGRFQVSFAFRSRLGTLTSTSTPLAWTWEWRWDPRHLEQHENNFPCQDSRITWKTCLHTILSNWNMNGWLIEKCLHTVNPHFQDDLVIADQLVCWLGTFVFCILCLILSNYEWFIWLFWRWMRIILLRCLCYDSLILITKVISTPYNV